MRPIHHYHESILIALVLSGINSRGLNLAYQDLSLQYGQEICTDFSIEPPSIIPSRYLDSYCLGCGHYEATEPGGLLHFCPCCNSDSIEHRYNAQHKLQLLSSTLGLYQEAGDDYLKLAYVILETARWMNRKKH